MGLQRRAGGYPTHRYELVDDDEKFELTVDVPGVDEEDIDVKLEDGMLTVEGRRTASSESSRFTSEFSKSAPKDSKMLEENVRRIPVVTTAAAAVENAPSDR